jgi:hypothetical protein
MDRFNIVTNSVRLGLGGLANWLYGCGHRRTSFPISLRTSPAPNGQHNTPSETFVVCLDCGRHFVHETLLPARGDKKRVSG